MSVIPFGIAWFLAENPDKVKLGSNRGDLIIPPLPTAIEDFAGYDVFSKQNIHELKGHWVLINAVRQAECEQVCQDSLYKTQQLTLMMGKDIARIRRLALVDNQAQLPQQWQDDLRLLKAIPSQALRQTLNQINGSSAPGGLLLMDPLGNLMMKYAPGYDPYKVKSDLSKLLRISQIG